MKYISKYQFTLFRIILGVYLSLHFAYLMPYGKELFSREGMLSDARLNLTFGILPNPLEHWDTSLFVTAFLIFMLVLSTCYTLGLFRRTSALLLWYGWACLFNRNNLINNPGIPYMGFLLLSSVLIPIGEPLSIRIKKTVSAWQFPSTLYGVAWFLMAIGYSCSGWIKLSSPSWIDGSAIFHLVNNPLARPGPIRDFFLSLPHGIIHLMTWTTLAAEISFIAFSFHRKTRFIAWTLMILIHIGILTVVDFADLVFGMLMIHLFTFDPDWFPSKMQHKGHSVVLFDGVCALCDHTVQMLTEEDRKDIHFFAPLQGPSAQEILQRHPKVSDNLKSIIFVRHWNTSQEVLFTKSDAILKILNDIGGLWRVLSWIGIIIPRLIRDKIYDWISQNRYNWFGKHAQCKIPTPEQKQKFLP